MKVFDAFLFNDEIELLELRLHFLQDVVDHFVIVESARTLSGHSKPLYFAGHRKRFEAFAHKIIYHEAPVNELPAWQYEFFQRNEIRTALEGVASDEDWIHVSDADEIPDLRTVLPQLSLEGKPIRFEVPMFYYWMNLRLQKRWCQNLIGRWKWLRQQNIGDREKLCGIFPCVKLEGTTGWHFSFLFGNNIRRYQEKIRAFSHQEFNTPYYLDEQRIADCVRLGVDLFERGFVSMKFSDSEIAALLPLVHQLQLVPFVHPSQKEKKPGDLMFLTKTKYLPQVSHQVARVFPLAKLVLKKFIFPSKR